MVIFMHLPTRSESLPNTMAIPTSASFTEMVKDYYVQLLENKGGSHDLVDFILFYSDPPF